MNWPAPPRTPNPTANKRTPQASDDALHQLKAGWRAEHKKRSTELADELIKDSDGGRADARAVLRLAAQDTVLSELVSDVQAQVGRRLEALLDYPEHLPPLTRCLNDLTTSRNALTRRATDLLLAAGTLRNQRKLANPRQVGHLRVVA